MPLRCPAVVIGALGLTLALSACTPDSAEDSAQEPAPETVTVTQTAPAPESQEASAEADDDASAQGGSAQEDSSDDASEEPEDPESSDSSDEAGDPESSEDSEGSGAQEAAGADGLSARGNIPKQIGEEARLTASSGDQALAFTVTDIQPDYQCTAPYAEAPENESFVRIDIEATTGSAADMEELFYSDSMMFNPFDWKFVDSSGRTANEVGSAAAIGCLDMNESLPSDIGPGENVSGALVLDVTDSSGTLAFQPVYDSAGWEWSL